MKKYHAILLFFSLFFQISNVQSQVDEKKLLDTYKEFGVSTREIAYVHINKSTFIKNETLGFSAYILDKAKKESLKITKNLYCVITDKNDNVIKSKLVKVNNSLSHNTFEIDSLFSTGIYKFKAYTNWMLNFNERNYYEQSFYVIDQEIKKPLNEKNYTIQALPESGHLVLNLKNNVGIVVKDQEGFGLANANGKIVNDENKTIAEFTLNQFGIAKAPLIPLNNRKYSIIVNYNDKEIKSEIENIENTGIAFSIYTLRNKLGIDFKINNATKEIIKNKKFILAIHNGNELKTSTFQFNEKTEISKIINEKDLFTGINIFTVFDIEKNRPILERMYFNSVGINKAKSTTVQTNIENDSILVKLQVNNTIDLTKIQNVSISVLPSKTKSYAFNSNILSQTYLEPYVKGFIQDASYYFDNDNAKTKYDLDNLLITQGWSSYDWGDIFKEITYSNKFEEGINILANINKKSNKSFLVYPLKNNKTQVFTLTDSEKSFKHTNLFPEDNELYRVSIVKKNDDTEKPNLYLNYFPAQIPDLTIKSYSIPFTKSLVPQEVDDFQLNFTKSSDTEVLNGIEIKSEVQLTRQEKIRNRSYGSVDFFDDKKTRGGLTLAIFLSSRGFNATDFTGSLVITNPNPNSFNNNVPLVILDDVQLSDFSFLNNFPMNTVDYIEINKSGIGYGLRGGGGVIKIVTDPIKRLNQSVNFTKSDVATYEFPLTFNSPKKYYTPIYENYTSRFFKEYGTLDWFPNLKIDENGFVTFKILNTYTPDINIYIEGIVNGKTFISETKTIYPLD